AAQQQVPGISLATVYRNLRILADEGELVQVKLPGESPRYELSGREHHHHFQCRYCQRAFEVYGCPGTLAHLAPPGFLVEDHEVILYGQCSGCIQVPLESRPRPQAGSIIPPGNNLQPSRS
ncbi:MAG: transcriptional repressor, partial [Betaproteobacteria bacterium]|nr:transcriptional repressor [Betaproteobacteria bacterium]